jgi:GLPGLI family protein
MKTISFLIAICMLHAINTKAQNFNAIYSVERIITVKTSGLKTLSTTLNYNGYLYKSGNRYISFFKPLFLDKYEDGSLEIVPGHRVEINKDSVQAISYVDLDSNIVRTRTDLVKINKLRSFTPGYIKWQIMPETKNINGLECQRALMDFNGKTNLCEIWFCSDLNIPVSLRNLPDLPGLLVEANYYSAQETYKLISYKLEDSIPRNIFWPAEFKETFYDQRAKKN